MCACVPCLKHIGWAPAGHHHTVCEFLLKTDFNTFAFTIEGVLRLAVLVCPLAGWMMSQHTVRRLETIGLVWEPVHPAGDKPVLPTENALHLLISQSQPGIVGSVNGKKILSG